MKVSQMTQSTTPSADDVLMMLEGGTANKKITFGQVGDWVNKEHEVTSLETTSKTVAGAINEIGTDVADLDDNLTELKNELYNKTSTYQAVVQGVRYADGNIRNVIVVQNRCTSERLWELRAGDVIAISDIASGTKSQILGTKSAGGTYTSGWKTDDFSYTVAYDGVYAVNTAKTTDTDNISPSDVETVVTITDNNSRLSKIEYQLNDTESALNELESNANSFLELDIKSYFAEKGKFFPNYETGARQGSDSWVAYTMTNRADLRQLKVTATSANSANAAIVAFYDNDTSYDATSYMGSAYAAKAINGTNTYIVNVPDGCEGICVATRAADFSAVDIIAYSNTTLGDLATLTDLGNKVDKVTGKGLSEENFTAAEKTKLDGLTQVIVDPTLTQSGQAADAKVTGENIANLRSSFIPFPESPESKLGTSGQVLQTLGNGKTKWTDPITELNVAAAIDDWLDEHPEATTTVVDGSITESKLAASLKPKVINNYVTPEMYGALGDGSTDDSQAIQNAINAVNAQGGGIVQFGDKTYACQGLLPKDNVTLRGTYSTKLTFPASPTNHLIYYYSDTTLKNFNLVALQFEGPGRTNFTYDFVHVEKPSPFAQISYVWDASIIDTCVFKGANVGIYCSISGNVKIVNTICQYNNIGVEQYHEHFHMVNVMLWANGIGANIHNANHFTWVNVTFAHNDNYGIYAENAFESGLFACSFIDNTVHFCGPVTTFRIIGCRFISAETGITGLKGKNIVSDCYFGNLTVAAIVVTDEANSGVPYCNSLCNNMFVRNEKDIIVSGNDEIISGNNFVETEQNAINLISSANGTMGIEITNNHLWNCSKKENNVYAGILITSTYIVCALVANNVVRNDGVGKMSYAIEMDGTFTGLIDILVANNVSRNMKTAGYKLKSSITTANNIGTITTF